jgi:hypothetical protein
MEDEGLLIYRRPHTHPPTPWHPVNTPEIRISIMSTLFGGDGLGELTVRRPLS